MTSSRTSVAGPTDLVVSLLTCGLMFGITWFVMRPTTGWDDANITMNYAQNIANGLGYVYFEGGERVEGSTSVLWTALIALCYLVADQPETLLVAISFGFTLATFLFTVCIGRTIFRMAGIDDANVAFLTAFFFILIPEFFSVVIWSLMETTLVCFAVAGLLWVSTRIVEELGTGGPSSIRLGFAHCFFGLLIVLSRPEGIVLTSGAGLVLLLLINIQFSGRFALIPLVTLGSSALAYMTMTAVRLAYFGYPFPNTYYAKVSTDRLAEIEAGLRYVASYLTTPEYVLLLALIIVAVISTLRGSYRSPALFSTAVFFALILAGGLITYTLLGGDHFPGHRYFQIFLPILIPTASLGLAMIFLTTGTLARSIVGTAMFGAIAVQTWAYSVGGHWEHTRGFRLADTAREIGRRLNEMPGKPSVAVYIAGGISITYEGPIYDMNGLNWVDMAHAERETRDAWGGFSKSVFYATLPEIVTPHLNGCKDINWSDNPFVFRMLHGLFQEEKFRNLYEIDCWNEMSFFRLRRSNE